MNSTRATAHRAGAIYFVFMIVAIIREFAMPSFVVPGNAAATAVRIEASPLLYRAEVLTGFATLVMFIALVSVLYGLFRDVDRGTARLMTLLVLVGVSVATANLLLQFVPLVLLRNAAALSALTRPQMDALSFAALRMHGAGSAVPTAFWGLWLFPFGALVARSGWFPRVLGVLLWVAGVGYVVTSVAAILLPDQRQAVTRWMMPLYFGEVPIILWMLVAGARVPAVAPRTAGTA